MSQPVKLSDELVVDARVIAKLADRSIAGQIEHWAQIGRAVEPLLRSAEVLALKESGEARPLSDAIAEVDSQVGRKRVYEYLNQRPYPHFESSTTAGLLVKIDEDGTRTLGRFVNREFVVTDSK